MNTEYGRATHRSPETGWQRVDDATVPWRDRGVQLATNVADRDDAILTPVVPQAAIGRNGRADTWPVALGHSEHESAAN